MDSLKTVIITGAASGLGRSLSLLFSKQQFRVILVDIDELDLKVVEEECLIINENVESFVVDLAEEEEVLEFIEKVKNRTIDILVNNAGVMVMSTIHSADLQDWELMSAVNIEAPFLLIQNLMHKLKEADDPLVINIGSKSGVEIQDDRIFYTASKFALRGFTLVAAKNLLKNGIQVKLYTLGSMLTNLGTESIEDRLQRQKDGKAYLNPDEVAKQIFDTMYTDEVEIEIMP